MGGRNIAQQSEQTLDATSMRRLDLQATLLFLQKIAFGSVFFLFAFEPFVFSVEG